MKGTRGTSQREASLEHDARQPRLVMEANGPANTKACERTEGAAIAVQAMRGDSCSADLVDPDLMCSTSSGNDSTGPPAPPCSGKNALGDNRAAAPKSCLPFLEISSHRRSLHANEDHLQQVISSTLRDQGGEFEEEKIMDFNSIRLVQQQLLDTVCCPLLPESY